jgi:hypothetical protein
LTSKYGEPRSEERAKKKTNTEERRTQRATEKNVFLGKKIKNKIGTTFLSPFKEVKVAVLFILLLSYAFPTKKSSSVALCSSVYSVFVLS